MSALARNVYNLPWLQSCKAVKLSNAASLPAAAYMSKWAKEQDYIGACLSLGINGEQVVLVALALLHLARSVVVYYEAKDPCVSL